jgi:hypothetical protein
VDFIRPLTPEEERKSLDVFSQLAFLLQFCPPVPSETELRARFARLGIEAGRSFDPTSFSSDLRQALQDGIADAWVAFGDLKKRADAHEVGSGDVFGTRDYLKNNYLYRMLGAAVGIYGNSKQEAMYPTYFIDSEGRPADASSHGYAIKFDKGQLPPANAFWSLTLYGLPNSLLVANRLNRYLINSTMLPQLQTDADGGLTLYVQKDSPGADKEANWLPAPNGPFFCALRIYWPKDAALSGAWTAPKMRRT